jgi:hypothetical protein
MPRRLPWARRPGPDLGCDSVTRWAYDVMSFVATIASLLGLGSVAADPAPDWVVLKISRVQVKARRIDGSTWDLPGERRPGGCGVVGLIGKAALSPLGGSFSRFSVLGRALGSNVIPVLLICSFRSWPVTRGIAPL